MQDEWKVMIQEREIKQIMRGFLFHIEELNFILGARRPGHWRLLKQIIFLENSFFTVQQEKTGETNTRGIEVS